MPGWSKSDETLNESQGDVGDFLPSVIDDQGVAPAGYVFDLGDTRVVLGLDLEGGLGDGRRYCVVAIAGDNEQWTAMGFLESTRVSPPNGLKFATAT